MAVAFFVSFTITAALALTTVCIPSPRARCRRPEGRCRLARVGSGPLSSPGRAPGARSSGAGCTTAYLGECLVDPAVQVEGIYDDERVRVESTRVVYEG